MVSGSTRVAGVIGWPVDHSLSPVIHNAAAAALGVDLVYVALPVPPAQIEMAIGGLPALGFAGANVTMPHKAAAAELADEATDDVRLLRAANTLLVAEDRVLAENTDAPGFDRFLRRDAAFEPAGRTALLFGAGGAARACALALARAGAARLTVAVRDPAKATGLEAVVAGTGCELALIPIGEASAAGAADLVVNATPLGARGEALPLPPLGPEVTVVDLLYHPPATPLQTTARLAGASVFGGLGLLLHQAALSFELWTGRVPPLEVMSAAALAALAERA